MKIVRNLGIRWHRPEPRAGFDPDLCIIEPPPPDQPLNTLRLWEAGHVAPWLAIEVVSPGHPYKDYVDTPQRCAACGVGELWVYDPLLAGPRGEGGPFALQIWSRVDNKLTRVHAGNQPGYSPTLQAWLHPALATRYDPASPPSLTDYPTSAKLRISNAQVGGTFWPTREQVLAARSDAVVTQLDATTTQLDAVTAERDAVTAERDAVTAERDAVTAERDAMAAERDAERAARIALEQQLARLRDKADE